jgi:hypothetical protein
MKEDLRQNGGPQSDPHAELRKWLPQELVIKKETGQAVNETTREKSMQGIEYP